MARPHAVTAVAPGTVANVTCGFDVLAFAIRRPADTVHAARDERPGVRLVAVEGDGGVLPTAAERNTAGVAALHLFRLRDLPIDRGEGVALTLTKGLPLNSGLGSSAASGVAAALAVDALLGTELDPDELLACAVEAERVATGCGHADNAAAAIQGGFVMVRATEPPRPYSIPLAAGLSYAIARPHLGVDTGDARRVLPNDVPLGLAVKQSANLAGLVIGLIHGDEDLIRSSMVDVLAEPHRIGAVPPFHAIRDAALEAGALGAGLAGSGASVFALCGDPGTADDVSRAMRDAVTETKCDQHAGLLGAPGARIVQVEGPPGEDDDPCAT